MDTSPQPSEELLSSQTDLRSSKCPQDRELPSIPPNTAMMEAQASGDSTYEVVKEMAAASRDISVEDSLYETVKDLKNPASAPPTTTAAAGNSRNNGSAHVVPQGPPPPVPNGRPSPSTPDRGPLCAGVEYASVDLKKKSRHSANMEAKRSSGHSAGGGGGGMGGTHANPEPEKEAPEPEEEEEVPPPLPEKVLDINDNQPLALNGPPPCVGLHNGEASRPPSLGSGFAWYHPTAATTTGAVAGALLASMLALWRLFFTSGPQREAYSTPRTGRGSERAWRAGPAVETAGGGPCGDQRWARSRCPCFSRRRRWGGEQKLRFFRSLEPSRYRESSTA
ncbi:hypothetical protein CRUP_005774 [Coryphaenoides rupestris]|nr:hypothetical protein CRUP_005774 [Coryphaenoides rupestris]